MLRVTTKSDIAGIQRVRHSVRENILSSTDISDEDILKAIEVTGRGWVVDLDGKIVAFAVGNSQTGNIWALFVDPDYEGRGYARSLQKEMLDWLWGQGLSKLWLTTEVNTRAEKFYTRSGWNRIGLSPSGEVKFELSKEEGI